MYVPNSVQSGRIGHIVPTFFGFFFWLISCYVKAPENFYDSYRLTNQPTGVGARDTWVSKTEDSSLYHLVFHLLLNHISRLVHLFTFLQTYCGKVQEIHVTHPKELYKTYETWEFASYSVDRSLVLNIAKGTTDPRVEFVSQVPTQILIKFHLLNLVQTSTKKSQPNISTKLKLQLSSRISTKI